MPVSTASSISPAIVTTLIDEISTDENVIDALSAAVSLACSKTLLDYVPGDSPLGYVGGRLFLDAVTLATGALRAYDFYPIDPRNQRQFVNDNRYQVPIRLIPCGAKKVSGGFKVAGKGYMTLYMIENCGQGTMFSDDESDNEPTFWVLHEFIEATQRLKIYLARPTRLLKNGTFLETTEFRTIYDNVVTPTSPVSLAYHANVTLNHAGADLPEGPSFSVPFIEIDESSNDENL